MRNPVHILVENEEVPLDAIKQFYVDVELEEHKLDTICDIYEVSNFIIEVQCIQYTVLVYFVASNFHCLNLLLELSFLIYKIFVTIYLMLIII